MIKEVKDVRSEEKNVEEVVENEKNKDAVMEIEVAAMESEDVVENGEEKDEFLLKILVIEEEWMKNIVVAMKGEEGKVTIDGDEGDVVAKVNIIVFCDYVDFTSFVMMRVGEYE